MSDFRPFSLFQKAQGRRWRRGNELTPISKRDFARPRGMDLTPTRTETA